MFFDQKKKMMESWLQFQHSSEHSLEIIHNARIMICDKAAQTPPSPNFAPPNANLPVRRREEEFAVL